MNKDPEFIFYPEQWLTPNTYDTNFALLPPSPGVYLLVLREFWSNEKRVEQTIIFVGSTKNLKQRCSYHPLKKKIEEELCNGWVDVACYFKVCDDYLKTKKYLIRQTHARYNKQWH